MNRRLSLLLFLLIVLPPMVMVANGAEITLKNVGVNNHFYHYGANLKIINLTKQSGALYVREEGVSWQTVEQNKGMFKIDPLILDYVNKLNMLNIRPVLCLHYCNKGYAKNEYIGPNTGEMLEAFGRYASFMATIFNGRIYAWEIWNEPDLSHIWQPNSNSKEYSQLVKYVAPIIRKIDPDALIVAGALSGPKWEYLHSLHDSGALNSVDVISFHWYTHPKAPDDLSIGDNFNQVSNFVRAIRRLGKKAWITEMGYPTSTDGYGVNETQQAIYLKNQIELVDQMGVELCFIYDLIDDGPDNIMQHRFGLFRLDDSPKPAVKVLNQINSSLAPPK